jgi:hypothetical protein
MGVVIPLGFGIVRLRFTLGSLPDEMVVTFGYVGDVGADAQQDAVDVNTIFKAAGKPGATAERSTAYTYRGVSTTRMLTTGPALGQVDEAVVGTKSAACLPPNCAMLVKKVTARGGRMGRGRMYVPPFMLAESDINDSGAVDIPDLGGQVALWNAFYTALAASDVVPALLHSDGSTPDEITAFTFQGQIATQRRRLRR